MRKGTKEGPTADKMFKGMKISEIVAQINRQKQEQDVTGMKAKNALG